MRSQNVRGLVLRTFSLFFGQLVRYSISTHVVPSRDSISATLKAALVIAWLHFTPTDSWYFLCACRSSSSIKSKKRPNSRSWTSRQVTPLNSAMNQSRNSLIWLWALSNTSISSFEGFGDCGLSLALNAISPPEKIPQEPDVARSPPPRSATPARMMSSPMKSKYFCSPCSISWVQPRWFLCSLVIRLAMSSSIARLGLSMIPISSSSFQPFYRPTASPSNVPAISHVAVFSRPFGGQVRYSRINPVALVFFCAVRMNL